MTFFNLETHLRMVGIFLILLAILNVFIPRRFGWPGELAKMPLLMRQVFVVHCVFIILVLAMMGVASLWFAPLLAARTPLAAIVLFGLGIFWVLRLGMQFFFYSPRLWRGDRFNTVMHVVFSCAWTYVAAVYWTAWALAVR